MEHIAAGLERDKDLVDDWPALVETSRQPLPLVVWENPLRRAHIRRLAAATGLADDATVGDLLATRGYATDPLSWRTGAWRLRGTDKPGHTLEHFLGLLHVQEEISLAPAVVLGAQPGERILDFCAAPGGKTACIAVGMDNSGTVVANDLRPQRLRPLRANCERLGVNNVVITPINGVRYPLDAGPFDRMLLDVPCSCEGNLRESRPASRAGRQSAVDGRGGLQATLLGRAWKLLRPGGVMVYSTCTFAPEENEVVLDYALGDDAVIEPFAIPGLRHDAGLQNWAGKSLRPDCANLARYWPHHNDTGGFTIARVRKLAP
jgi:16S rRNA C967 or C1407 C5-methylase (RsmB/RsmF family)